ncbi:hypothetical protein FRC09_015847 [Ceratobasidium sp. 395]|nr:hypothetical protein FRC09_015847 [Ceratobasidium sp. 395]
MTIRRLRLVLAASMSFIANFRQLVISLSKAPAPATKQSLVGVVMACDRPLVANSDSCLPKINSPRLIASTGACDSLDNPRVMAIMIQASSTCPFIAVFWELLWVHMLSLSDLIASMTKQDAFVVSGPECPKPGITVQRLGLPYMTPSPPRFIRWMLTRGEGRFRPIDICRPGWQRLAVQYTEGCDITDNDETGEPWSPRFTTCKVPSPHLSASGSPVEADVVDELGLNLISQRLRARHTFDSDFDPEQLQAFERLVAKRIRTGHLDSMGPLRQAVHNSLARVVDLKAAKRDHTNTRKRTRNHSRSSSNTSSFKLEEGQRLRRTRPTVRPLDVVAARAYDSAPPTDSPPESPGPTTPVEGSPLDSAGPVGIVVAGDEAMVLGERSRKGHVY